MVGINPKRIYIDKESSRNETISFWIFRCGSISLTDDLFSDILTPVLLSSRHTNSMGSHP